MSNVIDFQSFKEARIAREEKASQDAEDELMMDAELLLKEMEGLVDAYE
jgi:hypothetical protein